MKGNHNCDGNEEDNQGIMDGDLSTGVKQKQAERYEVSRKHKKCQNMDIDGLTIRSTQRVIATRTKVSATEIMQLMGVSGATTVDIGLKNLRKKANGQHRREPGEEASTSISKYSS